MKRLLAVLLATLMVFSTLTACGSSESAGNNVADSKVEAEKGDTDAKGSQEVAADAGKTEAADIPAKEENRPNNQVALKGYKDKEARSVVITFDAERLQICDEEDSGASYAVDLELIGDTGSVFSMSCKTETVQALYDETMDGYHGDGYSVTEMRDGTIAGKPAHFFEVLDEGIAEDFYFILELENGLCLYNGGSNGYEGTADFEEMLSYVFVNVEEGDGTTYQPPLGFDAESDGGVFTVNFDSGETFTLDYAEQIAEIDSTKGHRLYVEFLDEKHDEALRINGACVSKKYDSIEAFDKGKAQDGWWSSLIENGFPVGSTTINGTEIFYVYNNNYGEGLFFIPMTDEYAIRGEYNYYGEPDKNGNPMYSLVDAWTFILTGELVEGVETGGSQGGAVDYGYTAPTELGDTLTSMTYRLDGVLYQFPTPCAEFIKNGWSIPDVYKNKYADIPAGGNVQVALENSRGDILYNVVLVNQTDNSIALEDGLVMIMYVDGSQSFTFELPQGLGLTSSGDDIKAVAVNSPVNNSGLWSYAWWDEESDSTICAWLENNEILAYYELSAWW